MKKRLLPLMAFAALLASCGPTPPPAATQPKPEAVVAPQTVQPEVKPQPAKPEPAVTTAKPAEPSKPAPTKVEASKPQPEKVPEPVPEPVVVGPPPPAPDLKVEPASALQLNPVTVKTAALPTGTVVKYTLDGSEPENGKPFPAAGLSVTQSGRLRVWAAQPGGDASVTEALYTVGEVWVQPGGSGDGSWNKPFGTIEEAMSKAAPLGIKRLRLTSGTWTTKLDLSGSWDISGGWKTLGEPGAASVISGSRQTGATQKDPAYAIKAVDGAKVTLSGLEVRAPNSSFASAIEAKENSAIDIARSRLIGGNGLYGYGLRALPGASVVLTDTALYGGDGGSSFALSSEKATVRAVRATFDAGTGDAVSYGLNVTLTKLTLLSSVVWGGKANSSYGVGLYSSDNCVIQGSTILGGSGASAWAVYLSESEPEIIGCLLGSSGKAKSYGVFSNYGKSMPKALRANGFFGSASGAFTGAALGTVSDKPDDTGAFLDASGRAFSGQKGNVAGTANLGPGPEYKLLATSAPVLLKGGETLTGDAALDRGGKARGTSPALGAWAAP